MHPFTKEMHTRVCLSIHMFCIFFDFKDLSIHDREENTQFLEPIKYSCIFFPWPSKQEFVHSFHLQLPEPTHQKISILAAHKKSIQQNMLKFKLCLLSQGTTHCEGVFSELPGNALSQVQEPDLSAVRKAAAFNVSTQPWTHEQRSNFTCSCVNCRMVAFFFQSRVKCMKTSGKMFHMPLSHL